MILLNSSPIAWLNRPYFDLGPFNGGCRHVYGIELNYRNLISDAPVAYKMQVNHSPYFRESLLKETGMVQYRVNNPLQLANELRTERWNKLCDYLTHYQELQPATKLRVMNLLRSLCLHQTVLEYVPEMSDSEVASDPALAALAWCRAISNLILSYDYGKLNNLNEIEIIATNAPSSSQVRFSAAIQLVVEYAKTFKDVASAELWCSVATKEIQDLRPLLNDFDYKLLMSIYYRATSFVPLLHGDQEKVIQEMDLCEFYGESLTCENEEQQILANENRNILTESRTKEALWLGELDLAEERSRRLVEWEPLDPRYRLELGEILIKLGKIEEATKEYGSATRLGPPGSEIAWFMMGQCYQALGELEMACDCYLASLKIDPEAISALEKLVNLAPSLGNSALVNWSKRRLIELQEQKQRMFAKPKRSYISEASSELKTTAETMTI
ncbi:tetratricopeptide repeat protein [Coleofasciculus chthonoplastes]|uniref:tetratricopeptide repeat protein n=1 Tax=Coleofasciculus chthonoplastes TaxID=64178 RepID=UPI0032F95C6F